MRKSILLLSFALFLIAAPLFPQALTIGPSFSGTPGSTDLSTGPVRTNIDLESPASATGTVGSVHVYWSQSGCTGAYKIKFFRRSGNTLRMTAELGPFSAAAGVIIWGSYVSVLQGDLIGITRLTNCGNAGAFSGPVTAGYIQFPSDVTGSVDIASGTVSATRLAISGSGTASEQLQGIIPVVGSTAGSLGSNFKTSLQLLYGAATTSGSLTGRLVFHQAGTSGTEADPTVTYNVGAGQVVTYPDIVATFGRSGLGSIDLITAGTKPVIITRVFNDAGTAGSSGLTEDAIDPSDARVVRAGFTAFLVTPADPGKTRFNIGIRTGFSGAALTAVLRDTNGSVIRSVTKSYQPNWFEQVDSAAFLGTAIGGNQSIAITVTGGSAIVYGSTTDNITNDPNIQFATALWGTS